MSTFVVHDKKGHGVIALTEIIRTSRNLLTGSKLSKFAFWMVCGLMMPEQAGCWPK
ncbi:hypothetical protein SAMN04488059_103151 [Devosia psychrophila]|uniref:Uncharacterized protein n=1 Tax=Devosia psychrophila TaxID=728005 RepID=A0A1I1HSM8_9HYPH|nr:hypothetical protein SAMN04488059_103151 [Devosia psychrophila]